MYHCFAIEEPIRSADNGLDGFRQRKIDERQIHGDKNYDNNDNQSRRIGLLTRRPVDLFQFLPGLLNKLGRMLNAILNFLNPLPHEVL